MIVNIIKHDGTREPFDAGKIQRSIEAAARDASLEKMRTEEVMNSIHAVLEKWFEGKEEASSHELREKVLAHLEEIEPSVSAAWRAYDTEHKASI